MTITARQRARRSKGLGGSDAAAVLGLSSFKTALQLFKEKRGEYPVDPAGWESEVMWWGRMLEPVVRQRYAKKMGRTVRVPRGTLYHPEHRFMLAHIDGFTVDEGVDLLTGELDVTRCRGYEGKTAYHSTGWGEQGTDQIPTDALLQTHHYLTVTGFPAFDVCALIGRKFATYEVLADREMSEMLIEQERGFWERVCNGEPPPLDFGHKTAIDVVKKLYHGTNGARLIASEDAVTWRRKLERAQRIEKACKARIDECKARLLDEMGEAALLAFGDGKAYRRQLTKRKGYEVPESEYIDFRLVSDPNNHTER